MLAVEFAAKVLAQESVSLSRIILIKKLNSKLHPDANTSKKEMEIPKQQCTLLCFCCFVSIFVVDFKMFLVLQRHCLAQEFQWEQCCVTNFMQIRQNAEPGSLITGVLGNLIFRTQLDLKEGAVNNWSCGRFKNVTFSVSKAVTCHT